MVNGYWLYIPAIQRVAGLGDFGQIGHSSVKS
jgi:hypothetical protein